MWQLDLLLTFKNSTKSLSVADVAKVLYLNESAIAPAIAQYVERGFLAIDPSDSNRFMFKPDSAESVDVFGELQRECLDHRHVLIRAIFSSSAQSFADAFKFGKEEEQ